VAAAEGIPQIADTLADFHPQTLEILDKERLGRTTVAGFTHYHDLNQSYFNYTILFERQASMKTLPYRSGLVIILHFILNLLRSLNVL